MLISVLNEENYNYTFFFPIVKKKEGHSMVPKELALSCN